jgi:RNA polymerase sigma factor (sigma-70 family)
MLRLDKYNIAEHGEALCDWVRLAYTKRGITREYERRLALAAKRGDEDARNRLVEAHMYIPLEMAWKLYHKQQLVGVELADLVSEGYFGLWRAVNTFQLSKGLRFQVHAGLWVRNLIDRAKPKYSRMIQIPQHIEDKFRPYVCEFSINEDLLTQRLMRQPTSTELAEEIGLSQADFSYLQVMMGACLSLDTLELTESAAEWDEFIEFSDIFHHIALRWDIRGLFSVLTASEYQVLALRLGLMDGWEAPLQEVGELMDFSRERVRQIEVQALRKIKFAAKKRGIMTISESPDSNDLPRSSLETPSAEPDGKVAAHAN